MNKRIGYLEPVIDVISEINNHKDKNIMLFGSEGSGKTFVLKTLNSLEKRSCNDFDNPIIDTSINHGEHLLLMDEGLYHLRLITLVIKKILGYIKDHIPNVYSNFLELENTSTKLLRGINGLYKTDLYQFKDQEINNLYYEHPEILLEQFLDIAYKCLDFKTITLIIDNFDTLGGPSRIYQKFMYQTLAKYLRLIVTISDPNVLNNNEKRNQLSKNNYIVDVSYAKDIDVVRNIIKCLHGITDDKLNNLLTDDLLQIMIEKTNSNLNDILRAFNDLMKNSSHLIASDYQNYLIDFIDNEINIDPRISGLTKRGRKLYL